MEHMETTLFQNGMRASSKMQNFVYDVPAFLRL